SLTSRGRLTNGRRGKTCCGPSSVPGSSSTVIDAVKAATQTDPAQRAPARETALSITLQAWNLRLDGGVGVLAMKTLSLSLVWTAGLCLTSSAGAAEKTAAERGQLAVRGLTDMNPQSWSRRAYEEVWKRWGVKEKPADYGAAFRERYGLHAAPY